MPRVRQHIDVIHRRSLRRGQLGSLHIIEAAPDMAAGDLLYLVGVDEPLDIDVYEVDDAGTVHLRE